MTEYASLDDLAISADDAAEDLTLSTGKVVKVRGLTRGEHMWITKGVEDDAATIEARTLSKCLLAPVMTLNQARDWIAKTPSQLVGEITTRIRELSGLGEGAQKSDVSGDGDD
jgi:hypothetical protein